jgi:hypothetical protein
MVGAEEETAGSRPVEMQFNALLISFWAFPQQQG